MKCKTPPHKDKPLHANNIADIKKPERIIRLAEVILFQINLDASLGIL